MTRALTRFLAASAEIGIADLLDDYASRTITLMQQLKDYNFPNATLRVVHQQVIYRLRQADAFSFQRPADHAMPNVMAPAMLPEGLSLGYHPIMDITDEVKDLVQAAIDHTTRICRSYGKGDEADALKNSVVKLTKAYGVPDEVVARMLASMTGYTGGALAPHLSEPGNPQPGMPLELVPDPVAHRFTRADKAGPGLGDPLSGDTLKST